MTLAEKLHAFDYANKKRGSHIADGLNRMQDLVDGPIAGIVRDAERYRWLREQNASLEPQDWVITRCDFTDEEGHSRYWVGCDLEAAIDEAISALAGAEEKERP